jgi:hypothetical protein
MYRYDKKKILTKYMYVLEMSTYLQVLTDWCVWCSGVRDYYYSTSVAVDVTLLLQVELLSVDTN